MFGEGADIIQSKIFLSILLLFVISIFLNVSVSDAAHVNQVNIYSKHNNVSETPILISNTSKNITNKVGIKKPTSYAKSRVTASNSRKIKLTLAQIKNGLMRAQKFFNSKGRLPHYVSFGKKKIPISQFQKILATKGLKINTVIPGIKLKAGVIHGYWINNGPGVLKNINIATIKKSGITDIFVLTNKNDPNGTLKPFINAFSGSGIKVHAWIICFKNNGNWYDPEQNPALVDNLVNNIISIASNYNVDGIHLDYVRYPGTAYKNANAVDTVTSFVQRMYNKINQINNQNVSGKHKILLSAALMPETNKNAYYYGQDYGKLAPYLNFLVPMIYKGNYNQNTDWIGKTTRYIVQNSMGKPVVAGIQTYLSDTNTARVSASELYNDIKAALYNGSSGYVLFKYGLIDSSIQNFPN